MIKVEVTKDKITFLGHAMYADYGKDIVCAAVSSIMMTTVESIAAFDNQAIVAKEANNQVVLTIKKHDNITNTLINTMLNLLNELVKKYPKNIKITNKEE